MNHLPEILIDKLQEFFDKLPHPTANLCRRHAWRWYHVMHVKSRKLINRAVPRLKSLELHIMVAASIADKQLHDSPWMLEQLRLLQSDLQTHPSCSQQP